MQQRAIGRGLTTLALILALLGAVLGAPPVVAHAAPLTVTSTADSGPGSLRQAIAAATPGEIITFALAPQSTIILTSGELAIDRALTIQGPGAAALTVSGEHAHRVFHITADTVTLRGLTIAAGDAVIGGGLAVDAGAAVTLSAISMRDNSADAGGGLYVAGGAGGAGGSVALTDSTVSGNTARGGGAGVYLQGGHNGGAGSVATLTNTTVSGNTAERGSGGGFFLGAGVDPGSRGGAATLLNSTIDGNVANGGLGGGLVIAAGGGGGTAATATLTNTIVSGTGRLCYGPVVDGGHNLDTGTACGFVAASSRSNADPRLSSLGDRGGPTQTQSPQGGSPAIDAGDPTHCPATDQRGTARPQGTGCDIGAVEVAALPTPTLTALDPAITPVAAADEPALALSVQGANFAGDGFTVVTLNGVPLATTYVSSTSLIAEVPAAQRGVTGQYLVTVTNGPPGGGTANPLPFTVAPSTGPVVTASVRGQGTVIPAGTVSYARGGPATYAASPAAGYIFTGWMLDGQYAGFAPTLTFTVNSNRTLVATFAARPTFGDVPMSDPDYQAITTLAALGIVNPSGVNGSGQFQPARAVARAEVAAFVARIFGWEAEAHGNGFPDKCDPTGAQGCVDDWLWNDVAALRDYGVVGGYTDSATCQAGAATAPCYLPRESVLKVQVVSIVARAFTKAPDLRPTGVWDRLASVAGQYTNVPDAGSQRSDLATYRANAGVIPGQASDAQFPAPADPATRRFVIQVLWQAYSSVYGVDRVP
jgi:hypothetical protein